MSFTSFILAAALILITPGPTNTILAASGSVMGWRRAGYLPLAEAAGYLLAITACLVVAASLESVPGAMSMMKAIAAMWLLHSASNLWRQTPQANAAGLSITIRRVFLTTLLNPKALLVGAILIPQIEPDLQYFAVLVFLALSICAGAAWTMGGSLLPARVKPLAYKGAAVVLGLFSLVAATSAIAGS